MVYNYLKIAYRNLIKHKWFSAINILGLSIGTAACLLILQFVSFELSFDHQNKNIDDIYRVVNDRYQDGDLIQHGTITYSAIGPALEKDFDEIINHTRLVPGRPNIIKKEDKLLNCREILFTENSFFSVFTIPMLAGDQTTAQSAPYELVLTESLARNVFDYPKGTDFNQFIDKYLSIENNPNPYTVKGIISDAPANSHLNYELLISYATLESYGWEASIYDFTNSDFWHYVILKPDIDYLAINDEMEAFSMRHFQGNKVSGNDEKFYLQPLSKAHLYSDFEYEIGTTGSGTVVWGLLLIALFIILIAWTNYINLTTARSIDRAKEVGIRKVVGGNKRQLIVQFLSESLLINLLAMSLSLVIVYFCQTAFNNLIQEELSLSLLFVKGVGGYAIINGLLITLICGILISGFYPAFVLSGYKPIAVLKGKLSKTKSGINLRKSLVIGQFTITTILIIGSIVVLKQLKFLNEKDLGFNIDQMLVVSPPSLSNFDSTYIQRFESFKNELSLISTIKGVTSSRNVPGSELARNFTFRKYGEDESVSKTLRNNWIEYEYMSVYNIDILAGRDFLPTDHNLDYDAVHNTLINKSAVETLGFNSQQEAVGQSIMRGNKKWDIVGVVNDFHQKSLRNPLEPTMFMPSYSTNYSTSISLAPTNMNMTIEDIKAVYMSFFPGNVFEFEFLDEVFNRQYQTDNLFGRVFPIFASLAIFVAILGLFGLAMFTIVQRTKEIGIRKVLGASSTSILFLLSKDFIKLVCFAVLLAFPIAWYTLNNWLDGFSYKIGLQWWMFVISAAFAIALAFITVSIQGLKTSNKKPVDSLRLD